MKKKDWILILAVLAAAGIGLAAMALFPGRDRTVVRITVDDALYGEYSLLEDRVIPIGSTNVCEIRDGQVRMTEASCPDQLCIRQGALDSSGQGAIICLPNRVRIEVAGGDAAREDVPDTIAG